MEMPAKGNNPQKAIPKKDRKMSALKQIPPLIKAYIRLGGFIGFGASVDVDFNSIDVCLVMDTKNMSEKYKKFYSQGIN